MLPGLFRKGACDVSFLSPNICPPALGGQTPVKEGADIEAQRLYELIGPKQKDAPLVFECGADWTNAASEDELREVAKLTAWIDRRERAVRELRARRKVIRDRCIKRRQRARVGG